MNFIDSALNVILNKMRPKKAVNEYDDSCPPFSEIPLIDEGLPIDVTWTVATHPIPTLPVRDLFAANAKLIRELCYASSLSEEEAQRFLLPVIVNLARIVHLVPASEDSEDGHHQGYGGLFRHSLEVAYYAANEAKLTIFDQGETPKQKFLNRRRWILTTILAGLIHDVGKVFINAKIVDGNGLEWGENEPLLDWLRRNKIKRYQISIVCKKGDYFYRNVSHFYSDRVIPKQTYAFLELTGSEEKMINAFKEAVLEGPEGGLIGRIVGSANSLSKRLNQEQQRNHNS